MSLWDKLPTYIHSLIFEYDSTFRKKYDMVIKEFLYRTPFWRTKYLNKNANNDNRFENQRKAVVFICNYWNNIYKDKLKKWINTRETPPENFNLLATEEEFLTDNHSNKYHIIFRDLNMLKTYNFIFNDHEVRLIRKHYARPESLTLTKRLENQHQCDTTT